MTIASAINGVYRIRSTENKSRSESPVNQITFCAAVPYGRGFREQQMRISDGAMMAFAKQGSICAF